MIRSPVNQPPAEGAQPTPGKPERPNDPAAWQGALAHSRYLRQLLAAHTDIADWLQAHADARLDSAWMHKFLQQTGGAPMADDEEGLRRRLRQLRQRVMAALIVRDLGDQLTLAEVVETMTQLADITTNHALDFLHRQLAAQFGEPLDRQGRPQRMLVLGMGKLGGRELNVSSDVDYIFIYPEDGSTAGTRPIEAYEFFTRLGKRLIAALGEITADGQVFRVDMRLRPNGDSGPLVCSITSLENYLITQGREWERYAWIKARVLNAGDNLQAEWVAQLEHIARPFVFRKYLDFGAINAMRDLHAQIRREVARKDMAEHIKLGPGGIREIEFMAQVFQLIRGGRDPALQIRATLQVLPLLVARRLLPEDSESELIDAYHFLRTLEHRLQYVDDAQTHMLPTAADEQQRIAASMHFADWPALLAVLDGHRQRVARHFEEIFSEPEEGSHTLTGLWLEQLDGEQAMSAVGELGFRQPDAMLERLNSFRRSGKYQQLPTPIRVRLDTLGPRLIEAAAATATPDATWQRCLDFIETITRRGAYLAMLQQYPHALNKLAEIVGSSRWAASYLTRHPILLDEVLDPSLYDVATDWDAFVADMRLRLDACAGDAEREMDILREAHHAQVFRLLAQDIAGLQTVERLADHLTHLADIVVRTTLDLCWAKLRDRHPQALPAPRFAVIAYGKLGGKELGYGSDLDLVFLHSDPSPDIGALYARLAQRMSTWMSSQTSAGALFETDLRLRPNGDAGMLVSTVEAFRDYQLQQAWVWEHQALTRARFCAGDAALGARFEAIRSEILRQPRDLEKLRADVMTMRQRMLDSHASHSDEQFDLKHDPGGLIDVEFIVQYLVLGYAHQHEKLCGNLGNIALLGIAAELALIPDDLAEATRRAYREYRRLQHALRLDGSVGARVARDAQEARIDAVRSLWTLIFNPAT